MMPHLEKSKTDFILWMNVTTSVEWTRPPVGIVRVEQSLAKALEELLGHGRFKQCVWRDGRFVEHVAAVSSSPSIEAALDVILPRTPTFDSSRPFLQRALERHLRKDASPASRRSGYLEVSIPLRNTEPMEPRPGDVLISAGLDWDNRYSTEFFSIKKKRGVHVITCCYDLIPVLFPHYCVGDVATRFKEYFSTLTWGSSGVLCISEQTKRDYVSLCKSSGSPTVPTRVIPLGDTVQSANGTVSAGVEALHGRPFLLFVSTIERRKNHEVLYKAYRILCENGHRDILPKLVFVGMPGWGVNDLLKDIELDPLTQGLIMQLNHVSDDDLNWLYRHAFFCVYPSLYEGWGLPVAEALVHGKAVLSSDKGSLPEVGGDLVKYVPAWNPYAWADSILDFCKNPERVTEIEARVRESYQGRSWRETAEIVCALADSIVAEQPRFPLVLSPGYDFSTQVGIHIGPLLRGTGKSGYLMFGPYWALAPGQYRIQVSGRALGGSATLLIEFISEKINQVFYEREFIVEAAENEHELQTVDQGFALIDSFDISLDRQIDDFQIRCFLRAGNVELARVNILRKTLP